MNAVPHKLARILELFDAIDDRSERLDLLIAWAEKFREVPSEVAVRPFPADHRAPNCESEAFVWAGPLPDGKLRFHFAVENPQGLSAKAFAAILHSALDGASPEEVLAVPDDLAQRIFGEDLSMGKNMGLTGMLQMMRAYARQAMA